MADDRPTPDDQTTEDGLRRRVETDTGYALTALPSTTARALAFAAVVVAGLCGGLIGFAVADLQCDGSCAVQTAGGALVGATLAAVGVGVVVVLVLRAMAEWKDVAPLRDRPLDDR